jgi:uncharacterized protein (DUF983 family)
MKNFTIDEIRANMAKAAIEIKHKNQMRIGDSMFKSRCPNCIDGTLLMSRDPETFKLNKEDMCVLCGQRYTYTDIEEEPLLTYKNG